MLPYTLHAPIHAHCQVFLLKLSSRFAQCKVLIVIVTPALFKSLPCLKEIYTALTSKTKIKIIPVLFEGPIPDESEQWSMVSPKTDAWHARRPSHASYALWKGV